MEEIKDLQSLTVDRLFCLQKLELKMLEHYIVNILKYNNKEYSINDIFNSMENLLTLNNVINIKVRKYKI